MSSNEEVNVGESMIDSSQLDDCDIDDPDLFTLKKHLTTKYQPLTIIKALEGKHK